MTTRRARSLRGVASSAGAIGLVLAGLVIGALNERAFQNRQVQSLSAQAEVLAASVEPALVFQDNMAAEDLVQALGRDRRVAAAGVYDTAGRRVAQLARLGEIPPTRAFEVRTSKYQQVGVKVPVTHEGRQIGLIYLRGVREPMAQLVQRHAGTALLLMMAVLVLGGAQAAQTASSRAAREAELRARQLAELNARLEAQIQRSETAEHALRQSQKMETLGQLTGGIAHDFNNLLQTVQGALDVIARHFDDPARVDRWARMGLEAAERGARLTAQLLAFSRSQKLELRTVNIGDVIGGMADLLPATLGSNIVVRFELGHGQARVFADATQLDLAILNLCINARDAMPNGGEIRIATQIINVDDDPELRPGEHLVVSVSDTGVGMPEDIRARAFEPFFTTKGIGKGTGLGLAQVYGIAQQAGGIARIESAAGRGTKVSICLPVLDELDPANRVTAARGDVGGSRGAQILVIDDDTGVRTYVCEVLTSAGYRCLQASDGALGLAILDGETVDLLIVDYAMPGLTGADVAKAVLDRTPDLPIIFASGYADSADLEAALGRPAELLRKPFDSETLKRRVADALA